MSASPMARVRGAALAGLLLVAAGVVAWFATRSSGPAPTDSGHNHGAGAAAEGGGMLTLDSTQAARIGVTFATAERGLLEREIRTVGQVTFDETRVRTISLKLDGWVEHLFVDFTGRTVRVGEPLLAVYSPMLISTIQELTLASRLARDVRGADSATIRGAESLVRAARARLHNWDVPADEVAHFESATETRRTLEFRAPYAGVIVEKLVVEGQRVMAGDPLYRIADLARVWVAGEVFESDAALVHAGQAVQIELAALPGSVRRGRIVFVQPTVDASTRTTRLRIELDNADGRLRPGMYATIRVRAATAAPVVHVPRSALLSTGRRDLVFVRMDDGMLEPREVVRGIATDDRIEIRSGLRAGEIVVASATFLIDAESNLSAALGGMAGMPGMEMASPAKPDR